MKEITRAHGMFGEIRVFERQADCARVYCINGSLQTLCRPDGTSLFGYVHAIKKLIADAREVLLIGGAGGSLATMLARRGADVSVVEIDPAALPLAQRHFALDRSVNWITDDAANYLNRCGRSFEAIVFDACDSNGTIERVLNADAVAKIMDWVRPSGALLVNLSGSEEAPAQGWDLLRDLCAKGFRTILYRPESGWEGNEILYVSQSSAVPSLDLSDLHDRPAETRTYLMSLRGYPGLPTVPPF